MRQLFFKFWLKYDLGQKYYAPQVRPDRGSNSLPPDHESTFNVIETPALATWPSVTSAENPVYVSLRSLHTHIQSSVHPR